MRGRGADRAAAARRIAHEIKNPLGGIRGAAQLLQMDLVGLHETVQGWLAQNVMLDAEQTVELDADDADDTLDMDAVTRASEGMAELPWDATLARLSRGDDFADASAEARLAAPVSDDPQVQVLEALAIEPMKPKLWAHLAISNMPALHAALRKPMKL